ncbi:MAG: hypothetical protein LBJ73_02200 [Rickettsiales bacterium]|jgi:hypothetical protein|nr:hypothetical protein [Rickettsiales bacterium]
MNYKKIIKFILPKRILRISQPEINDDNCNAWRFDVMYEGGKKRKVFGMTKKNIMRKFQRYNEKKCEVKQMHLMLLGRKGASRG